MKTATGILDRLSEYFVINSAKCVRVRHKSAECTVCMAVCAEDALRVTSAGGKVIVDWTKCSDCGKCMSVCSNGVFSMRRVDRSRLLASASEAVSGGTPVVLSCGNAKDAKSAAFTSPALAGFTRKHMIRFASMGAGKIIFLHGDCVQCGKGCMDFLNKEIQAASAILALCGKETEISLSSSLEKDSSVREKKRSKLLENRGPNLSRRQFFGYLKTKTKVSVGSTLHYLAENEENKKKTVLTADVSGTENEYYVNALIALGGFELIDKMLSERLLPSVSLDMERCKLCAVCSKVCPNGVFTAVTDMVKGRRKVTAIRMDSLSCTGCGICALSCPSKVIKVVKS